MSRSLDAVILTVSSKRSANSSPPRGAIYSLLRVSQDACPSLERLLLESRHWNRVNLCRLHTLAVAIFLSPRGLPPTHFPLTFCSEFAISAWLFKAAKPLLGKLSNTVKFHVLVWGNLPIHCQGPIGMWLFGLRRGFPHSDNPVSQDLGCSSPEWARRVRNGLRPALFFFCKSAVILPRVSQRSLDIFSAELVASYIDH